MIYKTFLHPILESLIQKDIELTVGKHGVYLEGFYKAGTINLIIDDDGKLIAHSRYGQINTIGSVEDLVVLNYEWWQKSKGRSEHWEKPEQTWKVLMIEYGLLKNGWDTGE